jgi:TonB-linked SusC/RagA family outer membrane protein
MRKLLLMFLLLFLTGTVAWSQADSVRTVTGKVTSADDGTGLPGVNVIVEGTTKGTSTDAEGNYSISLAPSENTLSFSFVGFQTVTHQVGDRTTIDVVLELELTSLDEVVVIGYGEARKSDLTGAVASVKGADLERVPASSAGEALQGRVAGVQVTQNSRPGSAATIRVRGLGSVSSRTEPLYVVDGVLTDDISFLGSTDIQSINILKDASASAIYGIRASGGVVIITTKRGNKEAPRISYNGYGGFQKAINIVDMSTGPEYIQLLNEKDATAASRTGTTFTPRNPANYPASTNWYDEILRESPSIQSHDINLSGGNENTQFAIGGSYFYQGGLAKKTDYQRINVRTSVESQAAKFLKLGLNANFSSYTTNNVPGSSSVNGAGTLFQSAYIAPPAMPVMINDTTFANPQEFGDFGNPAASQYYYNNQTQGIRLVGGVFADVMFTEGLTFRTYFGLDGNIDQNRNYVPRHFVSTAQRDTTQTLTRRYDQYYTSYWDNTLTYKFTVSDDHAITAMLGMNASQQRYLMVQAASQNVPDFGESTWYFKNRTSPEGQTSDDNGIRQASLSYFGRLLYNFKERYVLTATLRRDESTLFPEDNRAVYFPSVGLGWILSEEPFMEGQETFQYLKLRGSWGEMGNANIAPYQYVLSASTGPGYSVIFGGSGNPANGASVTEFREPNILWEYIRETDVAIEGEMFDSRLSFEIDFYRRKTFDAIFQVTTNAASGYSNQFYVANNADIVNRGIEASLNWENEAGDFRYTIGGVFAYNDNEVSELAPGTVGVRGGYINVTPTTYTVVGHSIGEFYGRRVAGIFQTEEDVLSYVNSGGTPIQPDAKPGDFKYEDVNGDGMINDNDRTFLGSAIPKYNYGITLTGAYKGIDLSIDLYAQGGNKIYNAKRYRQLGNENYDRDFFENHWTGPGSTNDYPSADISADANKQASSWYLESGNFFKVRNIQLGYTFPTTLTSKISVTKVRIYATASNPLVFFKYNGFSPEIPTPTQRFNNLGEVYNNITSQGVDANVYPMAAVYNFGININL